MIDHWMTVRVLVELLKRLEPTDELVVNGVRNLLVVRNSVPIGYVDFNQNEPGLRTFEL